MTTLACVAPERACRRDQQLSDTCHHLQGAGLSSLADVADRLYSHQFSNADILWPTTLNRRKADCWIIAQPSGHCVVVRCLRLSP